MADVATLQFISLLLKACSDAVTLLMLCRNIECYYRHCFDVTADVVTLVFFVLLTSADVATLITRCCDSNIMSGHSPYDVATLLTQCCDIELVLLHNVVFTTFLLIFFFFSLISSKT